jgi:catechol-2,3-dioxygenase
MKRLHVRVHVAVDDLERSVRFYSTLFAAPPSVVKPDCAKWTLEDPRVNFAVSARAQDHVGLDHLGIQVERADELVEVYERLKQAEGPVLEQGATTCCYAKSETSWIADPQGAAWEAFFTQDESTVYGDSVDLSAIRAASACCAPTIASTQPALAQAACSASKG